MITYTTRDGGTVQATRRATATDLHYRNAEGRTVASVVMPNTAADSVVMGLARVAA